MENWLTYVIGLHRWTVSAADGSPMPSPAAAVEPEHSWRLANDTIADEVDTKTGKVIAKHSILWRPSTFRIQNGRLYAFTADGHAYAMSP